MAGDATATRLRTNCGLPAPRAGRPVPASDGRRPAAFRAGSGAAVPFGVAESTENTESAPGTAPQGCTDPDGPVSTRTWLYRIATDEVQAAVEKARRTTADAAPDAGAGVPGAPAAPLDGRPEARPHPVG